jgi:hypothetical protein
VAATARLSMTWATLRRASIDDGVCWPSTGSRAAWWPGLAWVRRKIRKFGLGHQGRGPTRGEAALSIAALRLPCPALHLVIQLALVLLVAHPHHDLPFFSSITPLDVVVLLRPEYQAGS